MYTSPRLYRVIVAALLVMFLGVPTGAQAPVRADTSRSIPAAAAADIGTPLETRASLEAEARKAEEQHRPAEAWLIRARLRDGDFQEGDKILLKVLGSAQLIGRESDTVTVRAGKMLPLPQLPDLALDGVLRSELTARLQQHLSRFLRDSTVRATPLLRVAVFGQVRVPGYYYVPSDYLLNDLIMKAQGPNQTADVGNMIIRRGNDVIWTAQDTRTALSDGMSLERLGLHSGDELYVDDLNQSVNYTRVLQYISPIVGILTFLLGRLIR